MILFSLLSILLPNSIAAQGTGCAQGYFLQEDGNIPGTGSVDGVGNGQEVDTCRECGALCSAHSGCRSYECYIDGGYKCNLNEDANPSGTTTFEQYFCTKVMYQPMTIGIEACDGWAHPSYSSSLQLQIRGVDGQTEFFIVNEESALPINGERVEFELSSALVEDIGEIYGVQVVMSDVDGYCIAGLDIAAPQYKWIVDGNHENDVDLEPECKAMTATNSNYNEGMASGTGIGYHCCLDQENESASRAGCESGSAYTYQQAEDNCAAVGFRVCAQGEVWGLYQRMQIYLTTGTGCDFDHRLVWTSTSCTQTVTFDSAQFGNGIILRPQCLNSFVGVSDNLPLLPCFESKIDLLSNNPRGIYNLALHSCNMDNAGLSVQSMQNSLYTSIQGTSPSGSSYIASGIQYLDHFTSTGLNWDSLGKITATNWQVSAGTGDLYTKYEVSKSLIGIKLEAVQWKAYPLEASDFSSLSLTVKTWQTLSWIDETYLPNSDLIRVVEDGRYVIVGFGQSIAVTPDSVLTLSSINYQYAMNVHLITADDWEDYDLPFISYTATSLPQSASYTASEIYCRDTYGTSLLSIHSEDQKFLLFLFQRTWPFAWYWIGLNDRQNEGVYEWTDRSALNYVDENMHINSNGLDQDCVYVNGNEFGTGTCSVGNNNDDPTRYRYRICTNPAWSKDETRTFQINTDKYMEEVVSVTIGNNNADSICFDEVIVNEESASYMSANWISSAAGTDNIMSAIFKYPVCESEVIAFRLVPDTTTIDVSQGNVVEMHCSNHNRLISTQCGVSQSYETTTTTSLSFGSDTGESSEQSEGSSTSRGRSREYNWGSSSSFSYGTENSQSTTTSDEFSFGFTEEIGVSAEAQANVIFARATATASLTVGSNQQWTRSTEETTSDTTSQTSTNEEQSGGSDVRTDDETNSVDISSGVSSSTSQDHTYETSETFSVSCEASTDIPPGHRMDYSLIFTKKNSTIKTYTDMKLTLCSAFLNPAHPDDPQNFIYINNIEGALNKQETTTCNVDFAPAEALINDISCIEEQRMAISSGAYYIPTCKEDEPSEYSPCQCESVDTRTSAVCYCVDTLGNIVDNQMKEMISETTTVDVCAALQCETSVVSARSVLVNTDDMQEDEIDFNAADADKNGLLSFEEMIGMEDVEPEDIPQLEKIFDEIDANNDGAISADEMRIYAEANPENEE